MLKHKDKSVQRGDDPSAQEVETWTQDQFSASADIAKDELMATWKVIELLKCPKYTE